jgi:hypothetical protein
MAHKSEKQTGEVVTTSMQMQHRPLFFTSPCPLNLDRHKTAGLVNREQYDFAKYTNSIPLNTVEFIEASTCFPIVFTDGELTVPLAVVGLADGINRCIDDKGKWHPDMYIPAYVRKYPFALMEVSAQQYVLCIDEVSSRVMLRKPDLPFYQQGKPAPLVENAMQFCQAFHAEYERTIEFCNALKAEGLLVSRRIAVQHQGKIISALQGFLVLDEQKLPDISEKTWLQWRQKGWIFYLDAVLISMVNWKKLASRLVASQELA